MLLLLTILSVLALWAFLTTLAVGLLLIFKPLEGARKNLQQIAMGVRAIEQETMPLGQGVDTLSESLDRAADGLSGTADRLLDTTKSLTAAAPNLRSRL